MKSVADDGGEPEGVSSDAAQAIMDTAERMIEAIAEVLREAGGEPSA